MKKTPKFLRFKRNYTSLKEFVPQVAEEELNFLEMTGFYDGPLDGLVEWGKKKYRYEIVSDFVNERRRYFAMLELNDEEYQNEMYWHRRFQEYILQGRKANQSEWNNAYTIYKKECKSNYGKKEVAAWFYMY